LSRGDLTEAEWGILKGLLPIEPENRGRGRRPEQNRSIINGILWRLRCGAPWRDVPPKYGSWNTIYRRFLADKGYDADAIRADLATERSRLSYPVGQTAA